MMFSVAIIGADGAGKSTVAGRVETMLPFPARSLYMGVNLEASSVMLPTTRLLLLLKRSRGRRPDMVLSRSSPRSRRENRSFKWRTRAVLRLGIWLAEEAYRSSIASRHRRRGEVVIFDRHFFADYYDYDIAPGAPRSLLSRLHGFFLTRVLRKPDLVLCLDAPGDVLHERKPEASYEWLEERRQQYLSLGDVFPHFEVIDATRPLEDVLGDVRSAICAFAESREECIRRRLANRSTMEEHGH